MLDKLKRGASLQGYGLMIGLVAVVALGATTSIGSSITGLFGSTADTMDNVVTGANAAVPDPSPNATPTFGGSQPTPGAFTQDQAITPFTVAGFGDADDDALIFTLTDGGSGIAADFTVTETDTNSSTADGTQVEITGTPTQAGNHTLTITATDPDGASVQAGPINLTIAAPAGEDVFYQCQDNSFYVVFAENVDNQPINSTWTSLRDACAHYGYRMLATTSASAINRESLGTGTNSNMLAAIYCNNCRWYDGGNAWYYHRQTDPTGNNCSHVQGVAPAGAILAGGIPNENETSMNCATFQQEINSTVVFGANVSGEANDPFYLADHTGTNNDPNCTDRTNGGNGAIAYTGTPDYLLCAHDSLP